ncbi:hypothetical protein ACFROC_27165, partial [Nocardia tengchongensis]
IPKWKTIVRIVIPTALPGMISGMLLAVARVMDMRVPNITLRASSPAWRARPLRPVARVGV